MEPNIVDGWLCRDKSPDTDHPNVVLFKHNPNRINGGFYDGWWWERRGCLREWTTKEWKKEYDLVLPRKGHKFEVTIEL